MVQEDKELLLKDIRGRLPYNQIVQISLFKNDGRKRDINLDPRVAENIWELIDKYCVLPYLRSMSSMTRVEVLEYISLKESIVASDGITYYFETYKSIDWLNAHHFDYRGLIEKGLALEAPDGMYHLNEKYYDIII
jgi:hypothetical protein